MQLEASGVDANPEDLYCELVEAPRHGALVKHGAGFTNHMSTGGCCGRLRGGALLETFLNLLKEPLRILERHSLKERTPDFHISFCEGDTFTYEEVTRNSLHYIHDGSSAAEDSMAISVTGGTSTTTMVLKVRVSLKDREGPSLAPGCPLAITVVSRSSVTITRSHLAYVVSS